MNNFPIDVNIRPYRNHYGGVRTKPIRKIAIHHVAGVMTARSLGEFFARGTRVVSANYGIGYDGSVGLYVPENYRAYTTGHQVDEEAITIEVSNSSTGGNWPISEKSLSKLIELCTYICRKYGIKNCSYTGGKDGVLQMHKWYASTSCPGPYLSSKFPYISQEVNKRLKQIQPIEGVTEIEGESKATEKQMVEYLKEVNPEVKPEYLKLPAIFLKEGAIENIRGDIAFAQSLLETGNFNFGGDVKPEQNNYAGIGATGGGVPGHSFDNPTQGVRAQIQHLKAYANTKALNNELVDPRFKYVTRGSAKYVEWLGIQENPDNKGWAASKDYGYRILDILQNVLKMEDGSNQGTQPEPTPKPSPSAPEDGNYESYKVIKGDTLWGIAQKLYDDGEMYHKIKEVNKMKDDTIYPGQILKLPKDKLSIIHTVKKGDTLWNIAEKYYGDGSKYTEIKRMNNLKSDVIHPGDLLSIKTIIEVSKPKPAPAKVIKVGSTVRVKRGARTYDGESLLSFVFERNHKVSEIAGNRAVITYNGVTVAAIHIDNLILV